MSNVATMPPGEAQVTKSTIGQVLVDLPDLTMNGFSFSDRGKPCPATDLELLVWRFDLLSPHRVPEIQTACDYIRQFPIEDQQPVDSYALKHRAERWGRTVGKEGYVCNGAAIVAAILCGYPIIREKNSPNCKFKRNANTLMNAAASSVGGEQDD